MRIKSLYFLPLVIPNILMAQHVDRPNILFILTTINAGTNSDMRGKKLFRLPKWTEWMISLSVCRSALVHLMRMIREQYFCDNEFDSLCEDINITTVKY